MKILFSLLFFLAFYATKAEALNLTYWVSKSGSDANACFASASQPTLATQTRLTVHRGMACLSGGDTLNIKSGTYSEHVHGAGTGTADGQPTNMPNGSAAARTKLEAIDGKGTVIIRPPAGPTTGFCLCNLKKWFHLKNLVFDGVNLSATTGHLLYVGSNNTTDATNSIFEGLETKNAPRTGFVLQGGNHFVTDLWTHDNGSISGAGLYLQAATTTVEYMLAEDNVTTGVSGIDPAGGTVSSGTVVKNSIIRNNGNWGIITRNTVFSGAGGLSNNIIYGNVLGGVLIQRAGNLLYNNSLWSNTGNCVRIDFGSTSVARNNICYQNSTNTISENGTSGNTISNNLFTNPSFANTATGDFRLLSGSVAINAGLAGAHCSGQNGTSGCTQGAYDPPRFLSCRVADGDPNTIRVTFSNNRYAPILTGAVTGITISVNGDSRTESAPTVMGTNLIHYTIDGTPIIELQTVTWAAASTNTVTDSANIGNLASRQNLHTWSAQACTNEVAGAPTGTWDLKVFSFRDVHGTEPLAPKKPFATAPNSTPIRIIVGGSVRIRAAIIRNTADTLTVAPKLYCKWNAGSYFAVPSAFDANNVKMRGTTSDPDIPQNQTATTNLLGAVGAGSFVPGLFILTSEAIPSLTIAPTNWTEMEWLIDLDSDVTPGDVLTCEVRDQDGSVLNASPTTRPTATVINQFAAG